MNVRFCWRSKGLLSPLKDSPDGAFASKAGIQPVSPSLLGHTDGRGGGHGTVLVLTLAAVGEEGCATCQDHVCHEQCMCLCLRARG